MEIVFILGGDNSGKSTLVRCLSGLGRGNHSHPSDRNIAELSWVGVDQPLKTCCLISSLNERPKTISPKELEPILDGYEAKGCSKAILCISTSVYEAGWAVQDYFRQMKGERLGQHIVTHVCRLRGATHAVPNGVSIVDVPEALRTRNGIASHVRKGIGLL